jgi:cytochrome c oxidase subunit 2
MPIAVVLIVLVVGSLVFHFLSPMFGWTFTPIASNWGMIDSTVDITFIVTGIVFVAVNLFMAYAIIRYRHREDATAKYEPENKKLEVWLTVLTTIGVAAMLTPGLFVWAKFVNVPEGATEIEAIAQQWKWSYRLPGKDGEFGNTEASLINEDNPFGMDADDPIGLRSSGSRWTPCPAWSRSCGWNQPKLANTKFSVKSCVVSHITPCAAG